MGKGKPRAQKRRIEGEYEISTGMARVLPDPERDGAYILEINKVPSSPIVLGAPRVLLFEYMVWASCSIEAFVETHRGTDGVHLTHLGGAACTLPRYFADRWPTSRNEVVELDEKLAVYVREWFEFPEPPAVSITVAEARSATHAMAPGSTDVLIRDVFVGGDIPEHLCTVEFFVAAHRALASGGLYVANHAAFPGLQTTRRELAGMREVFPHVAAVADPEILAGRMYGNMVLLGSDSPIEEGPILEKLRAARAHATTKGGDWVEKVKGTARPRLDRA